jgi:hypothetical protein
MQRFTFLFIAALIVFWLHTALSRVQVIPHHYNLEGTSMNWTQAPFSAMAALCSFASGPDATCDDSAAFAGLPSVSAPKPPSTSTGYKFIKREEAAGD